MAEEKKSFSILDYAKKLNKEYDSKSLLRVANVIPGYKRLQAGALGMDYPLRGGLPYGRVVVFSGKEHSGKTTAACAFLAAYQKENPDKMCVFVDVEQSIDLEFQALMNGVDLSKLIILEPEEGMSGESILGVLLEMQLNTDDIGLIILDSIPTLETAQNLKNDFEKDMGKQATIAKPLQKFLKEILPSLRKKDNILILINQVRVVDVLYNGAPIYDEPGGSAPKFYSSVTVRFGNRVFMKGGDEMNSSSGEGSDGFQIKFKVTKNKTADCRRGGGFITYRYDTGMDKAFDLFEIATKFEFINKLNQSTYQLINLETGEPLLDKNGKELKGYKKVLLQYINDNPDFKNEYIRMLSDYISASNTKKEVSLLELEDANEIDEEEKMVEGKQKEEQSS